MLFFFPFSTFRLTFIYYGCKVSNGANFFQIFDGNSQSNQVVRRTLLKRIVSRHLRFLPVTWFGWTCMRVEIFGCRGETSDPVCWHMRAQLQFSQL